LPTDAALFKDPSFKVTLGLSLWPAKIILGFPDSQRHLQVFAEKYAEDQEAFFKDYAEAHAKLSDLGAKFDPPEVGITILPFQSSPISCNFCKRANSVGRLLCRLASEWQIYFL
jgi:hypothetical protein